MSSGPMLPLPPPALPTPRFMPDFQLLDLQHARICTLRPHSLHINHMIDVVSNPNYTALHLDQRYDYTSIGVRLSDQLSVIF